MCCQKPENFLLLLVSPQLQIMKCVNVSFWCHMRIRHVVIGAEYVMSTF
jgi:hypothetical protein